MKNWYDAKVDRAGLWLRDFLDTPAGRRQAGCVAAIVVVAHLIAWTWRILG